MNVLFVVTRNEAELLRLNLAHHLAWGFDHAAIADDESTDATRDVLRSFGDAVTVTTVSGPSNRFRALAELLRTIEERHGEAQWVAVSDTDEFWWGPGIDLRSMLRSIPPGVVGLNAQQKLFLPTAVDPPDEPVVCRRIYRTGRTDIPLHTSYVRGKSIYRASRLRRIVLDDAHRSPSIPAASWKDLDSHFVHHYMIESEDAFVRKVRSRLRWNPSLKPLVYERRALRDDEAARYKFRGFKRAWWDIYATRGEEGLRDHYRSSYLISGQALRTHLASGDLVLDRAFADFMRARLGAHGPTA